MMRMGQTLQLEVKYRGYLKLSDATGLYVSFCPMLDIMSQGRTQEEARASLDDAVRLFVTHCFRRGILEQALKRRGLEPVDSATEISGDVEGISVRPAPKEECINEWSGSVPLNFGFVQQVATA